MSAELTDCLSAQSMSIASGGSSGSLPSCFNALFVVKFLLDLTFFGMGVSDDTFSLLSFEAALFDGVAFESVFDRDDSERPDFTVDALVALVAGEEGAFFEERLLVEAVVPLRFLVGEDDCFLVLVATDDGLLVLLADADFFFLSFLGVNMVIQCCEIVWEL